MDTRELGASGASPCATMCHGRFGAEVWKLGLATYGGCSIGCTALLLRRCMACVPNVFFPTVSQIVFLKSSQMNEFKQQTRWSPRTRMLTRMLMVQMSKHMDMQSRTIPFCNSLFEQSCTCFPCYQSAVWSGKCRVWSVECEVRSVECKVCSGECRVRKV